MKVWSESMRKKDGIKRKKRNGETKKHDLKWQTPLWNLQTRHT